MIQEKKQVDMKPRSDCRFHAATNNKEETGERVSAEWRLHACENMRRPIARWLKKTEEHGDWCLPLVYEEDWRVWRLVSPIRIRCKWLSEEDHTMIDLKKEDDYMKSRSDLTVIEHDLIKLWRRKRSLFPRPVTAIGTTGVCWKKLG